MAPITTDHPLRWLLAQLPAYLAPDALAELLARFAAQKAEYGRQVQRNKIERQIIYTRRWPASARRDLRLQTLAARLAALAQGKEEG